MKMSQELKKYLTGYIFPVIDIKTWMEQNSLSCDPVDCPSCGETLYPKIPIADKLDRGVVYSPCQCGDMPPVTLIASCPIEREKDRQFYQALCESLS